MSILNEIGKTIRAAQPPDPAKAALTAEWIAEVSAAKGGANWFTEWPPACKARFGASVDWIATEDALDVPGDLLDWTRDLAKEYRE